MKIDIANFTIRPFEPIDLDYAAAVKLVNQDWPNNQSTVEIWKDIDSKRNPKHLNRRYIGEMETEKGKQIVAVGFVNKRGLSDEPGKYFINFYIDKEFESLGLAEPLYTRMVTDLADKNPVGLKNETREDKAYRIQLFEQKGFHQTKRPKRYSELNVSSFEFGLFTGYSEKVAASGIVIATIQELETRNSNWMQKLYDMDIVIDKDIHDTDEFKLGTDEFKSMGLDEFAKMFEDINFRPDAQFVAVDGDNNYVGISSLWPDLGREDLLYVGTTRVLPSHRRHGIATALKLKTIEFAKAYGVNTIQTRNEVNSPMYNLNMKLGFQPGLAVLTFEKAL